MTRTAGSFVADETEMPFRITLPAAGTPTEIVVLKGGMGMRVDDFDILGDALAKHGIATYAMPSRSTITTDYLVHATDFDELVAIAARDFPGVPRVVAGESFGADAAVAYKALNPDVPVIAMPLSIVTKPSFTGPREHVRIGAALAMGSNREPGAPSYRVWGNYVATHPIKLPQAKGIDMTTNPTSQVFKLRDPDATLPAGLFADAVKLVVKGQSNPEAAAPTRVFVAGADTLVSNVASYAYQSRLPNSTLDIIDGAGHVMTQETHIPDFMTKLVDYIKRDAAP